MTSHDYSIGRIGSLAWCEASSRPKNFRCLAVEFNVQQKVCCFSTWKALPNQSTFFEKNEKHVESWWCFIDWFAVLFWWLLLVRKINSDFYDWENLRATGSSVDPVYCHWYRHATFFFDPRDPTSQEMVCHTGWARGCLDGLWRSERPQSHRCGSLPVLRAAKGFLGEVDFFWVLMLKSTENILWWL